MTSLPIDAGAPLLSGQAGLLTFALIVTGMVLTPGPNMIYVVSRSITQGRRAGMISLAGVALGFLIYMLASALGIAALLVAVPLAYNILRFAGAAYLLYLAWDALRPGGHSPFALAIDGKHKLRPERPRKLFFMGLFTNLLNPKVAMIYLSLLPQFLHPAEGNIFGQTLKLGLLQIVISLTINSILICTAGTVAVFLADRPLWLRTQRWFMGTVLGVLAARMALESRPA